jgi:tetratricopeptide (TPR) repeat protein
VNNSTTQKTTGDQSPAISSGGGDVDVTYDNRKKFVIAGSVIGMVVLAGIVVWQGWLLYKSNTPTDEAIARQEQRNIDNQVSPAALETKIVSDIELMEQINEAISYDRPLKLKLRDGEFEEAQTDLEIMLSKTEADDSANSERAATQAFALGGISYLTFKYEKALEYYQKAVQYEKRNPQRYTYLTELGRVSMELGDYDRAQEAFTEALDISRAALSDQLKTAASLNDLGKVFFYNQEFGKAEDYFNQALALRQAFFGTKSHALIADIQNNLAVVHEVQGDCESAIETYREVLRVYSGEENYETKREVANAHSNLGIALANCEHYDDALKELQLTLRMRRNILGEEHPSVAFDHANLGEIWLAKGDISNAIKEYEISHRILVKRLTINHQYTKRVAARLHQLEELAG